MKLSIEEIANGLSSFPVDLKAEVLINRSLGKLEKRRKVVICPKGLTDRGYRKDITNVNINKIEDLEVSLSRDSLYDALPEGLFHQPLKVSVFKTADEMIAEMYHNQKVEQDTRNLFLPFDDSFGWLRVFIEKKESVSISLEGSFLDLEDFCTFWNIPQDINRKLVARLLWVYPIAPHFAGKKEKIEELLRVIFQIDIKIEERKSEGMTSNSMRLNDHNYLGYTFCLGENFNDDVPEWVVHLKVETLDEHEKFSEGGSFFSAIKLCESLLFPAEITPKYKIDLMEHEELILGNTLNALLGVCSFVE